MSEMSLYEQISAIETMIEYIEKTLPGDIRMINEDVESAARYFRQYGRTDLADGGVAPHMASLNLKMEALMTKLYNDDLVYLYELRDTLYNVLNVN